MRLTSILRAGLLGLALIATQTVGIAFAASDNSTVAQSNASAGVYDGADFQAAKRAFN